MLPLVAHLPSSERSYYIDGETTASIQFSPSMMSGVGFDDPQAPWGTKWIGKGAKDGAWFHNFKIPFQKTIRVTAQRPSGTAGGFYCIVRGVPNVAFSVGNVAVPSTARLVQTRTDALFQPLDWVNVIDVASGKGPCTRSTPPLHMLPDKCRCMVLCRCRVHDHAGRPEWYRQRMRRPGGCRLSLFRQTEG